MLDAKKLGQLLLMQNVVINLPSRDSVISFVCKGLAELPGVSTVEFLVKSCKTHQENKKCFNLKINDELSGALVFNFEERESFEPYTSYVQNFIFMLEVILQEKSQRAVIEKHQNELEEKVKERTISLMREIEERKKTDRSLRASEILFRTIFQCANVGIALVDLDGRFLRLNKALIELLEYEEDDLIGTDFDSVTVKEDISIGAEFIKKIIAGEINIAVFEKRYRSKSGRHIDALVSTSLVRSEEGEHCYFITHISDITKRKLSESKLEKSETALKQQVEEYEAINEELNERNEELRKAKERAEESDRLKTEFLNNVSHEVRTPMNGILGFISFLQKDISEKKRNYYINIIQNCSFQLLRIIDDLLEISKLETKQVSVKPTEESLNEILLETFSIFDAKAKKKGIPLYLGKTLTEEESRIFIDKSKLNKILHNLLENALKYTLNGQIDFGYTLNVKDNMLEIFVKDTGVGIEKCKQKVIFERFAQAEDRDLENVGGLGLGLSIAKENAELLGGTISVSSEKGKGAHFLIRLPYRPVNQNVSGIKMTNTAQGELDPDITILIVEDDEINTLFLESLIEDNLHIKYHLIMARNGLEAVNNFKANIHNIDLILMDIKIPLMNGYEATKQIRKLHKDIPIIAQTAYSTKEDKQRAFDAGCNEFLVKPLHKDDLLDMLTKYSPQLIQ